MILLGIKIDGGNYEIQELFDGDMFVADYDGRRMFG